MPRFKEKLTERLLLEEEETGVEELKVLGKVVQLQIWLAHAMFSVVCTMFATYVVEHNERLSPATAVVANGVEDTATNNGGHELLNEENQEDERDGREVEVVDQEESLKLEGLTVAHELAATENDGVVDDNEDGCRLEGGHGCLERDKLELLSGIANNHLPALAEDGP